MLGASGEDHARPCRGQKQPPTQVLSGEPETGGQRSCPELSNGADGVRVRNQGACALYPYQEPSAGRSEHALRPTRLLLLNSIAAIGSAKVRQSTLQATAHLLCVPALHMRARVQCRSYGCVLLAIARLARRHMPGPLPIVLRGKPHVPERL